MATFFAMFYNTTGLRSDILCAKDLTGFGHFWVGYWCYGCLTLGPIIVQAFTSLGALVLDHVRIIVDDDVYLLLLQTREESSPGTKECSQAVSLSITYIFLPDSKTRIPLQQQGS